MLEGNLCRECKKRTKQLLHLMGWCLAKDKLVSLAIPTKCELFVAREGAELQEPTAPMLAFAADYREQLRKKTNRARNAKRSSKRNG